jgi:type IV pilus assembly protein PilF
MMENNLKGAREKIDRALEQNEDNPTTQMAAGFIYDRLDDKRKAKSHFERAIRLAGKDNPDVVANSATFFCLNGEIKRGEELLLQAANSPLYANPAVAYTNAGRCARVDGRPQDAEQHFRRALAIDPKQPIALLEMAELALAKGNGLQARAFLERYTAVAPVTAETLWLARRIELRQGDATQAARYAQQLQDQFPTSHEASLLFEEQQRPQKP